ncbi:coiled-coil domain-containing protein [Cytobacillus gottheilii]|uniref:C40 family peptidase n=1 Tax=Cytobacillus gottheilii TaxID=859144 RepID=A0ABX8F683_9BACI|nr:C40 family peptidase [Cytobacillus gottheilii]QVY59953.1 C40 family peptidase [Cytobacillus gottheilii]
MLKKKLVVLNTTIMLGLGSLALPAVQAETVDSIQKQRSTLQSNLSAAEKELAAVLTELAKLDDQVKRVDQAVADNNEMIIKTEADIKTAQEQVKKLESEIAVIQERIDKRNEILKERALAFQESGGSNVGYIEVLLGSTSFGDFIDRVGAVSKIVEADQSIIAEHDADKQEIADKKVTVDEKLADLNGMKAELEGMRAQLEEQSKQNDELKKQLNQKKKSAEAKKAELNTEDQKLAAMQRQIEESITRSSSSSNAAVSSNVSYSGGTSTAKPSGDISTVINAGYKYIGNSVYVFGGGRNAYDIANGRFDCSGFVSWAFAQAGISVGASTDSLKNTGTRVPTSQMQPGDLVFFNTYKTDGHVGIYLGGGKFIGSQSSTGVAIANMNSGYWADTFNGRVMRVR